MKVIEGGKKAKPDRNEELTEELVWKTKRATNTARNAMLKLMAAIVEEDPDGNGVITAMAIQCGLLMAAVELGFITFAVVQDHTTKPVKFDREQFLHIAGSIYDDVAEREDDDQ